MTSELVRIKYILIVWICFVCGFLMLAGGLLPVNAAAAAAQKVVEDAHQPAYAAAALLAKPKPKARVRGQAPAVRAQTPAEAAAAAAAAATVGLWDPAPAPARAPKKPQGDQFLPAAFFLRSIITGHQCIVKHAMHCLCSCTHGCRTCQYHLPLYHKRCI